MRRILSSALASVIFLAVLPVVSISAQDGDGALSGFGLPDPAAGGEIAGLLGVPAARAETSAYLSGWNPSTGVGSISVRYVFPEGYHQVDDPVNFTLVPNPYPGLVFGSATKAEPVYEDGLASYYDETLIVVEFLAGNDAAAGEITVEALFQICDEKGTCLFPDAETHVVPFDPDSGAVGIDEETRTALEWASKAELVGEEAGLAAGPRAGEDESEALGSGADSTGNRTPLWLFLLMALAGGILLNVMPCVLPLLSVKALGLVKQAGEDRNAILRHSWLYVAGIIALFWALGAAVIALQASGRLLGWGFQFQSPGFVLALTAVIWVFALSMFDVFVIEPPKRGVVGASKAGARGGYLGSFLTGVFAVLVATPCTAPFLGPALGFAFSQSPAVILGIFGMTGVGLGLPFLVLGAWPGAVEKLPKPGKWMTTFKEAMGFLLLGTAVYLFTTFMKLSPGSVPRALWWLLFLGFASWMLGKARNPSAGRAFRIAGQVAALAIAVVSGILLIEIRNEGNGQLPSSTVAYETETGDAIPFVEEEVLALIESGEPVFLEFTASWCTTCKVNQRILKDRDVRALMDERGVVHVKGDLTSYDETLTRWLGEFGRAGVPLYVLYAPGEEPFVFPELLGKESLVRKLEALG